jgi:hypothetical protein
METAASNINPTMKSAARDMIAFLRVAGRLC